MFEPSAKVAVLGAGLIGIDLVDKIKPSPLLDCQLVVGRSGQSSGLRLAEATGCATASDGIAAVLAASQPYDIVFDATNAMSHAEHWAALAPLGTTVIDLTPSRVGHMVVPTLNAADALQYGNISLISCGGQAAVPILQAIAKNLRPTYIEVVTTAASRTIGRHTRLNLDEYMSTTADAIEAFTGISDVKVICNISPADPAPIFRVAMSLLVPDADAGVVREVVDGAVKEIQEFVPGFGVAALSVTDDRVFVAVEVQPRSGTRFPRHAGNLEIINSAAVLIAEQYASSDLISRKASI